MIHEAEQIPISEIKNKEEVRVYRLHLLEEGQHRLLDRIDELERNLDARYGNSLEDHEKRITLLEECCNNYTKFKWLVIVEALGIVSLLFRSVLGV